MDSYSIAKRALVAGLVLALAACDDGLTDINTNPNAPTDVGAEFLLPQSIRGAVEATFGAGQMLSHTAIWPQQAVQLQYPDEEEGSVRASRMQSYWNNFYVGPLMDVQRVIEKGVADSNANYEGVGRIWKSYIFHIVTDLWGDVPYSEALIGDSITTPAYDAQKDIYTGMIADLTTGAGKLSSAATGFGSGDILYGDDMDAWKRFANSLRMRLAMRMSEVDPTAAKAAFIAAYSAGPFTSNADNAKLAWPGSPYENPLYENWTGRDDHGVSATMIDTLTSLSDPRRELYAEPATQDGTTYRGQPSGKITQEFSLAYYSRIGNYWRKDGKSTPTVIMSYSEVLLLAAEAAKLGWITGDAGALYTAGIQASMEQYAGATNAPTAAEITAYLAQSAITYNATNGLDQIHLQQWIGLFMGGSEAWSNVRRTDSPNLVGGPDLTLSRIPVRFSYPALEESLNATNLDAAISRQGGGKALIDRVWWDVN